MGCLFQSLVKFLQLVNVCSWWMDCPFQRNNFPRNFPVKVSISKRFCCWLKQKYFYSFRSYGDVIFCWFLQLRREGVLLLRGLDSRLSKDLPSDLQKLRCKVFVGFHFSFDVQFCLIFTPFHWENLGLAEPKNFIIGISTEYFLEF